MKQCLMSKEYLQDVIQEVLKKEYRVMRVTKLLGGAQKGTYKIECTHQFNCVLYIWDPSLSYFESAHTADEFTSNSAYLFKRNYELLEKEKISIPKVYTMDLSKGQVPFEYALVEYIEGGELEALLDKEKHLLIRDLKENLRKLHSIKSSRVGDLKYIRGEDFSCEAYIKESLDQALAYLFENYEPIAKLKKQLLKVNESLYTKIEKRKEYTLIHFELGPNHVMVDEDRKTYLIDFEGMKYFDLEYEYSFLQLRFGKYYEALKTFRVDNNRMKYYLFYHHIAAIEGAYQLLIQGYEGGDDINNMIHYNYEAILTNYLG